MAHVSRLLLCFLSLLPAVWVWAGKVDSLKHELLHSSDTSLVKILNELTWAYRTVNADSALFYGQLAVEISQKNNFVAGEARAYSDMGVIYFERQNYAKALGLYEQAVALRISIKDSLGLAAVYSKIGMLYQRKGLFEEALNYQQKALRIYTQQGADQQVATSYHNIGTLLKSTHQYKRALNEHFNALRLRIKLNDMGGLSNSYGNIAAVYKLLNQNDSAEYFGLLSVDMARQSGDAGYLSTSLNDLSAYKSDKGAYTQAFALAEEGFKIREALDDKKGMISSLTNMAQAKAGMEDIPQAIAILRHAEDLSQHVDANIELERVYPLLARAYESMGSYQQALHYQKLYKQVADSVLNEDLNARITEMQMRYETAQKEQQIALLSKDNLIKEERNKRQRNIFTGILAFFLVGAVSYYNFLRSRKRKELYTTRLLEKEAQSRAVMAAEEQERLRIAKELHDGVGQMLTAAKMNLEALQSVLDPTDKDARELYYRAFTLLRDSSVEIRSVSHSMMPDLLLKMGLVPAVKELVRKLNGNRLQVDLLITGLERRAETSKESVIYRVLQELLGNVVKHAQATRVNVQLLQDGNQLTLMVEDDGIGFDTSNGHTGVGMKSIASRVDLLQGQVYWDSQPGKGTTVTVEVLL